MYCYRITKYNPEFRDKNGIYLKNEWTSVNDIGKVFDGEELTKEKYLYIENGYISAIKLIMEENNISTLMINCLEKYYDVSDETYFSPDEKELLAEIKDNMNVSKDKLETLIRMALRELLWCKLRSEKVEIEFGYDYYMYIKCDQIKDSTVGFLLSNGIFVELI